jgi:hypothetical protein
MGTPTVRFPISGHPTLTFVRVCNDHLWLGASTSPQDGCRSLLACQHFCTPLPEFSNTHCQNFGVNVFVHGVSVFVQCQRFRTSTLPSSCGFERLFSEAVSVAEAAKKRFHSDGRRTTGAHGSGRGHLGNAAVSCAPPTLASPSFCIPQAP